MNLKRVRIGLIAVVALGVSGGAGLAQAPAPPASQAAAPAVYKSSEEHFEALRRRANGGTKHTPANMPDWRGLWTREVIASFDPLTPYPQPLIRAKLKPPYAAAYAKTVADAKAGNEFDHLSYCLPAGMPRWLSEPFLREWVATPDETWLINEMVSEVRRVYTDGRGHPPADEAFPLWEGHSIGFWNGDTLVVHTNNMRANPIGYNRGGPPQSDQVSTVEQWRLINHDTMQVDVTVYDPVVLLEPWHVVANFIRVATPGARIDQWVCEENNNVVRTSEGATDFVLPGEAGYKDPKTYGTPEGAPAKSN